jgi:hypothetical protein
MTTAYTSLLGLALPVTGELSGTWGDTVNNGITSLLDTSVAGTTNISVDTDVTLTTTTGASNTARQAILLFSGARTALRTVVAPAQSKTYTVINATTGGFAVKLVGSGPTTGVTIIAGESAFCAWNGSDFVKVSNTGGAYTVTDLTVTGNTILGDANTDTATVNALARFNTLATFGYAGATGSTLTTSAPAFVYSGATTYTDTSISGGTKTHGPFWSFAIPTLANPTTATTYTNASTLYIAGAPAAGTNITITNPYALYVAAGASYFGGAVSFIGNTTLTTTTVTSLTDSGLTSGRVTYAGTGGLLQDSANLTFNGTTLTAGGLTTAGTTSTGVLSVTGNTTLGDAAADSVTVNGTISSNLIFTDNTYDIGASGATRPRSLYIGTNSFIAGKELIGSVTTTNNLRLGQNFAVVNVSAANSGMALTSYSGTGAGFRSLIDFNRSRGTTDGSMTAVATSDLLGSVIFRGADGTSFVDGAAVQASVDNTVTTGAVPTALSFWTTTNGTIVNRYSISSAGSHTWNAGGGMVFSPIGQLVVNGGGATAGAALTLQESAGFPSALAMINRNNNQTWGIACDANAVDDKILGFISTTDSSLRMGLTNTGNLFVGGTSATGRITSYTDVASQTALTATSITATGATSAATITIGANNSAYSGGFGLRVLDKTANGGGAQSGTGVYIAAPYDGTNASGGTYALTKYGLYIDDLYSFYGINSATANANFGIYVKGGANNYIAGTLGVGTASAATKLDVSGVVRASGSFNPSNTNWVNAAFRGEGGFGGGLSLIDGTDGYAIWAQNSGANLIVGLGSTSGAVTEKMRITTNVISLTGLQGIEFQATQSASGNANTLDDYEEGTWTPTFVNGFDGAYSQQSGNYTKIGRVVTVEVHMAASSIGTAGGASIQVGNFPFSKLSGNPYGAASSVHGTSWATPKTSPNILLPGSTTTASVYITMFSGASGFLPLYSDIGTSGNLLFSMTYLATT